MFSGTGGHEKGWGRSREWCPGGREEKWGRPGQGFWEQGPRYLETTTNVPFMHSPLHHPLNSPLTEGPHFIISFKYFSI